MIPTYTTVEDQFILLLIVHVHTNHLRSCQSLTAHTETATAYTEAHVIHVVGTGHHHHGHVLFHQAIERTAGISVTCTDA